MVYKTSERMAARKQARRRLFLDAAIRLFAAHGYHAATVPMIVARARSSTGAFYLYFRNKEDIYAAVLEDMDRRLSAALNEAMAREAGEQQMGAAVEGFFLWLAANPAEAAMLMEAAVLGGRLQEMQRSIVESHIRSVAMAIGRMAPRTPADDRAILARCWVGAALEAVMGWLRTPAKQRMDPKRAAELVKRFNLRGVGMAG